MLENLSFTLADAAPAAPAAFNPTPLIFMGCIFVIFYFLIIRPQKQQQKQQQALIAAAKTGDRIVTASGIHGTISNVKDTTVILKIADNVKIEIEKSSIGSVVKRSEDDAALPAAS